MPKVMSKPDNQLRGGLDTSPAKRRGRGNRTAEQQLAERMQAKLESVCSGQWHDEVKEGRTDYPIIADATPGMILGMAKVLTTGDMVSNNRGEVGTRRWTPPNNVGLEDVLDRLSIKRAGTYVHPPAIRYDHTRPQREALHYDPRSIRVDDPAAWILRAVKLADWPIVRPSVRIRRGRAVIGFVESCWAFGVCDLPAEPVIEKWVQVTE